MLPDEFSDFEEIGLLFPAELSESETYDEPYSQIASSTTYISALTQAITTVSKNSFVFSVRYLGASFVAVTFIPKAMPHVARYFAPSIGGAPSIVAATATVAFASGTVGLSGEASRKMAEGVWNLSSSFLGYMFNSASSNPQIVKSNAALNKKDSKNKHNRKKLLAN